MTENESFTIQDLEQCSYRYLQGIGKNLKLPCNVKKFHLINMIYTKKYGTESDLDAIIKQVKGERLKTSQARLRHAVKQHRNNLQGEEVSSTSLQSPAATPHLIICSSPQTRHTLVKYNGNELRPLGQAQSPRRRSNRLLRSGTNRQNFKYIYNNTVIGVIKSQNTIKKPQTQKLSDKVPIDAKMSYALSHFNTSIVNGSNSPVKKDFNELTIQKCIRKKPQTTQMVVQPNKRQRALSGIYPLNPSVYLPANPPATSYINIRGKDGKLTKINAVIQRKNYAVQKYDSMNQNNCVTLQDIINCNISQQVKNKYIIANSEPVMNKDYPNMFRVTEATPLDNQSSLRNIISVQENNDTEKIVTPNNLKDCSILMHRFNPVDKEIKLTSHIPVKTSTNKDQQYYVHKNQYSLNNETQFHHNTELPSPVTCCPTRRNQPLNFDQKLQSRLETITSKIMSRPEMLPMARPELSPIARPETFPISRPDILPKVITISNNEIEPISTRPETFNPKPAYTQTQPENTETGYNTKQWVYNQNHFKNTQPYGIDSSGEFYTYYHKKIRARRSISHRETEDNVNAETLPRIDKVFSKFNDIERDLTKPLYVQVSEESERIFNYPIFMANNHSTHLLENIYNFKNSFITKEPVLHMVTTTSQTYCTYSTPIITTPIAHASTLNTSDMYASPVPANPTVYAASERPCLLDLLKAAEHEDALQNDFRPGRTSSTSSASTSSPANMTIPEMVDDAMEIISQDGDYLERINSDIMDDLKIQCFNCVWTGPRTLFDYHLSKEHGVQAETGLLVESLVQPEDSTNFSTQWLPQTEDHI